MKRTLLVTSDFPPGLGGVSEYWKNLSVYMPTNSFFVLAPILPLTPDWRLDEMAHMENLRRTNFFWKSVWPHWLPILIYLFRTQRREHYDSIIAGQVLPIGTVLWFLKRIGILSEYIVSCHGMDLEIPRGRKKRLVKYILLEAKYILVNSDYTKRLAMNYTVNESKIVKVRPCPQRLPQSTLNVKQKYKLEGKRVLLTVSRLVPRKGIDMVIETLPEVWKHLPETVYLIVGEGLDYERLKNLVELHIEQKDQNKIIFVGAVPMNELASYYQAADLVVMPNRNIAGDVEGFGMVFLEAGLAHLPVVAGDSGGAGEAVKRDRTGFLIRPENKSELFNVLKALLTNERLRNEMGETNYEWSNSFSWKEEAEKLITIL